MYLYMYFFTYTHIYYLFKCQGLLPCYYSQDILLTNQKPHSKSNSKHIAYMELDA